MTKPVCDLLVIGGGPAGLSAAINGASEGLNVHLMDNGAMLGGQARESSAIENYPGFPDGITGNALMSRIVRQADKFKTNLVGPIAAGRIVPAGDVYSVITEDHVEHVSRSVILSTGLTYRRLNATNIAQFLGRGVYYGVPSFTGKLPAQVAVIGGANSAGQAVLALAKSGKSHVKMLIRKKLNIQMSEYLVSRILACPNIEVCEDCEVAECYGDTCLRGIKYLDNGVEKYAPVTAMYIYIGAVPRTTWLIGSLELDPKKFICTGPNVKARPADYYETSLPGVFAAGDIRSGSTKRIATAIGEGAGALQAVHKYLAG